MRMMGEIACAHGGGVGEQKMQRKYMASPVPSLNAAMVVGYALTSKKIKSFLPKLERLARKKGILFVAIDPVDPYQIKERNGDAYLRQAHLEVTVLDPPDSIQNVHNRQSMLRDVADLNISDLCAKALSEGFSIFFQEQLVNNKDPASIPDAVNKAGLRLPIVAKPLVAKSHELTLSYDESSIQKLVPALVLLEFISHELPPGPLLERLARKLRRLLGLRLFNLDIIREHGTQDSYYVIDINYFPGYGKMPEYELIFLRIFFWTWHKVNRKLRLAKGVQLLIVPVVTKCYASIERRKSTGGKEH